VDKKTILDDMKNAMKQGDSVVVSVLRMIISAIKNKEIDLRGELNESQMLEVIASQAKRRKDSIEAFSQAGRNDLKEKEEKELVIIQKYLPAQMTEAEVRVVVSNKIAQMGAVGKENMGKVMGAVMAELKGKTDGNVVKLIVQELLKYQP